MRLLICGTCPRNDDVTRGALVHALESWQVKMVVCFGASPAADWCREAGLPVRILSADAPTVDTLTWLFGLGSLDRVLALPDEAPVSLIVRAFEHMVPVWEVGAIQTGRADLVPMTIGRARRRWITPPVQMAS